MQAVLNWLDGRKAALVSISLLILSYLVTTHVITAELGTLISSIITVIGGSAHVATVDLNGENKLGFRK